MQKADLKNELKQFCRPSAQEVVRVEVPTFRLLMVGDEGDPNTSTEYAEMVAALYSVSDTTKFMAKKSGRGIGHVVRPLEGLW
jgi:hypothetical protein